MTDGSIASEVGDLARSAFGRLGEFFHIFDLSFIVSGAFTLGALAFSGHRLSLPQLNGLPGWIEVIALILGAYVCGMISLALGRMLNSKFLFRRPVLAVLVKRAIAQQGLCFDADAAFQGKEATEWSIYVRLWQTLIAEYPRSVAVAHLSRYWVMAATYDAVAVSLLSWAIAIAPWVGSVPNVLPTATTWCLIVMLGFLSLLCWYQGAKYLRFQVEDLIAALAALKSANRISAAEA